MRLADLFREPFRLFFPVATLAGLVGVALWPVMLLGWTENYPGPSHARLMVQGFFGGFILGFMSTAVPRLVGGRPFTMREVSPLLALFLGNVVANTMGLNSLADWLFVAELPLLFILLRRRCHATGAMPPPGFVLVGLAFVSALAGTALQLAGRRWELSPSLELLARLLAYHGFVLLPILGAGGFLLPRFLGLGTRREISGKSSREWQWSAVVARGTGILIIGTYLLESCGWSKAAGTLRALLVIGYLAFEVPLERLRWNWCGVRWYLGVGVGIIPIGILAATWLPGMRLTMSHLELLGGFGLITTGIAARVVFGHSGAGEKLDRFHPVLTVAALLMLLGMAGRIVSDYLPGIQTTHYIYAAVCWIAGLGVWAVAVLPRVLRTDPTD